MASFRSAQRLFVNSAALPLFIILFAGGCTAPEHEGFNPDDYRLRIDGSLAVSATVPASYNFLFASRGQKYRLDEFELVSSPGLQLEVDPDNLDPYRLSASVTANEVGEGWVAVQDPSGDVVAEAVVYSRFPTSVLFDGSAQPTVLENTPAHLPVAFRDTFRRTEGPLSGVPRIEIVNADIAWQRTPSTGFLNVLPLPAGTTELDWKIGDAPLPTSSVESVALENIERVRLDYEGEAPEFECGYDGDPDRCPNFGTVRLRARLVQRDGPVVHGDYDCEWELENTVVSRKGNSFQYSWDELSGQDQQLTVNCLGFETTIVAVAWLY